MTEFARRRRLFVWLPLTIALLALAPIIFAMPRGLDLSFDSIQYLSAGRNLLAGRGLSVFDAPGRVRPMTHFPPLFPIALAVFGAVFGDVTRGAWVLNLVATAATVLLVARLAGRVAGGDGRARARAALIAGVATAVTNDLAINATMLWSEPLFIVLVVATAELLVRSAEHESGAGFRGDPFLTYAALAAGASAITRYAGLAIIGGGVFALLLASRLAPRVRFRRAAIFGAISTAPLAVWLLYNEVRAGTATDRDLSVYVISRDELWVGLETLSRWVFPYDPTDGIGMLVALLIAGVIAFVLRETMQRADGALGRETGAADASPGRPDPRRAIAILSILIAAYGLFLLASITFIEHAASLNERLLSPALPILIALSIGAACSLLTHEPSRSDTGSGDRRSYRRLRIIAIVALVVSLGDQAVGLASWARHMPERSLGLSHLSRSADELLSVVRAIPPDARVYSNMPYMTYAFADRVVADLPLKISQTSLKPNPQFLTQLHQIADTPDGKPIYLVFFDSPYHPPFYTTAKDAVVAFPTAEKHHFRGGEVFVIAAH
jgi:hypothetical protein